MITPADISAVREFNRFYTAQLGLTRSSVYKTQFSLVEARVLYELGATARTRSAACAASSRSTPASSARCSSGSRPMALIERHAAPTGAATACG